jgi:hypothetical protein
MATVNIYGEEKEIKWAEVNEETNTISIYFTDFTYIRMENINIKYTE